MNATGDDTAHASDQMLVCSDTGLRCPACSYNLTGLQQERCPECGSTFDLAELRQKLGDVPQPATPWDTRRGLTGFLAAWMMAAFTPGRLAATFPPRYPVGRAIAYNWLCYGLAVLPWAASGVWTTLTVPPDPLLGRGFGIVLVLASSVGAIAGFWACEALVAASLTHTYAPAGPTYGCWRGLTRYASGFAIATSVWSTVWTFLPEPTGSLFWGVAGSIFLWWWWAMGSMVASRCGPSTRLTTCGFWIGAAGVLGTFVGLCVAAAIATVCLS